ncbi:unnamed protein product [Pieris brassicae]|uniref:Uncharacterized protein n=1 Tax=Pieris brassicae TaxID=7116 RepID=A0A9P0TPN4_PIEBR|nr:unnamed protein product [Pieris brassicae]
MYPQDAEPQISQSPKPQTLPEEHIVNVAHNSNTSNLVLSPSHRQNSRLQSVYALKMEMYLHLQNLLNRYFNNKQQTFFYSPVYFVLVLWW